MRCNCGVPPEILVDQHLIAEQVELLMIPGVLVKNNWIYKTKMPDQLVLGTGHMTFWYNKLLYLYKRHEEVKKEVIRRGFKPTDLSIEIDKFPKDFVNDWRPTMRDSQILRGRICERLEAKEKVFWRYSGQYIDLPSIPMYINTIKDSPLHYV